MTVELIKSAADASNVLMYMLEGFVWCAYMCVCVCVCLMILCAI